MKKIFFLYILAVAAKQGKPTDEKADDSGKEDELPAGKYQCQFGCGILKIVGPKK